MFRELRSAQQADITQLLQASIDSSIHLRALQAAGPRLPKRDACAIPTAPVKFFALIERVSALESVDKFPKFNPRLLNVIGIVVIYRKG